MNHNYFKLKVLQKFFFFSLARKKETKNLQGQVQGLYFPSSRDGRSEKMREFEDRNGLVN